MPIVIALMENDYAVALTYNVDIENWMS